MALAVTGLALPTLASLKLAVPLATDTWSPSSRPDKVQRAMVADVLPSYTLPMACTWLRFSVSGVTLTCRLEVSKAYPKIGVPSSATTVLPCAPAAGTRALASPALRSARRRSPTRVWPDRNPVTPRFNGVKSMLSLPS